MGLKLLVILGLVLALLVNIAFADGPGEASLVFLIAGVPLLVFVLLALRGALRQEQNQIIGQRRRGMGEDLAGEGPAEVIITDAGCAACGSQMA